MKKVVLSISVITVVWLLMVVIMLRGIFEIPKAEAKSEIRIRRAEQVRCSKVVEEREPVVEKKSKEPTVELFSVEDAIVIIPSVTIFYRNGNEYSTDEISLNVDEFKLLLNSSYDSYEWDYNNRLNVITVLYNFLKDNDVPDNNIYAILGNVGVEGSFGIEQKTFKTLQSIEEAREKLGSGQLGYGCVQWTYPSRQLSLLNYYEATNELFPNDWELAMAIAECCLVLEEIQIFGVFENLYEEVELTDAVGRVSVKFEGYANCRNEWDWSSGSYRLVKNNCSGERRVNYSLAIKKYFDELSD